MAGLGYKLFVNGSTLSATDLNTYVQQQTVMVFATTSARTTALSGVLAEGMVSYVTGTGLQYYTGTAWVNFDHTFSGSSSGSTILQASATASGTLTLPATTDTLVGKATTDTLTNKTLTTPIISTISNTGTLTLPTSTDTLVGRATTDTLTNKFYQSPNEVVQIIGTGFAGYTFDVLSGGVVYITAASTANGTVNFRGNGSTTLASVLAVGQSVSCVLSITNTGTAYYPNAFQIDGSSVTPKWSGGTAPSAGNTSAIDVYSFTIIKTAATPTYTVLAGGAVKFA
jgi:hypothetical protein